MKRQDIILIMVVVFISAIAAFFISGLIFKPQNRQQSAEVVDVIDSDFAEPPAKYFNATSVNPTQLITIGDSQNPNPFGD